MSQRPQVSDEEIKGFMDFQDVLAQRDQHIKIIKRTSLIKRVIISSAVLVGVGTIYWILQTETQTMPSPEPNEQQRNEVVVIPKEAEKQADDSTKGSRESEQSSLADKNRIKTPDRNVQKDNVSAQPLSPQSIVDEKKPAEESSYVQAEPINGYQELYDYFARNLIYPKEMVKDSIQGISTVTFIIDKDGNPGKIDVTNSLGPAFDKEITRLIESMPEWKPAVLNGKPVPSKISLPVTFQLLK